MRKFCFRATVSKSCPVKLYVCYCLLWSYLYHPLAPNSSNPLQAHTGCWLAQLIRALLWGNFNLTGRDNKQLTAASRSRKAFRQKEAESRSQEAAGNMKQREGAEHLVSAKDKAQINWPGVTIMVKHPGCTMSMHNQRGRNQTVQEYPNGISVPEPHSGLHKARHCSGSSSALKTCHSM